MTKLHGMPASHELNEEEVRRRWRLLAAGCWLLAVLAG